MLSDMFNSLCYRASRGFIIQENTYNMIFEGQNSISVRLPTTILSHAITCIHALRWHAITALCSDIVPSGASVSVSERYQRISLETRTT